MPRNSAQVSAATLSFAAILRPLRPLSSLALILLTLLAPTLPLHCSELEIRNVCTQLAQGLSKSGRKTVPVVDFWDLQGNVTELGRFLAERFSVELATRADGFEVVDRTHQDADRGKGFIVQMRKIPLRR